MTLLIYDCDGVLVDSELLANAALADLMTSLGYPMTAAEAVPIFTGRSLQDVMRQAEKLLQKRIPEDAGAQAGRKLLDLFRRKLKPIAGVEKAILSLPYRRCVASSSVPERLMLSLEVTGLAPLFGADVFSATQVARGKPAPDLFLFAAKCVGVDPSHCIVIEDSPLGIEAARAAGMAPIGFVGGSHATPALAEKLRAAGADAVVRSMAELPGTVERIVAALPNVPT
ncbi:MAG TPA: HAD-IA family hydrolase [Xanthobacteraceae bacterium]|jgi:HAD superfamily hydrolase (TIGR01509 family)|nr:HAD-IA family hydrolase [Xanthobacteraceae bacterium]